MSCNRPPWWDPEAIVCIQRRPSLPVIRDVWQPFCRQLLIKCQTRHFGRWQSTIRLRRQSYLDSASGNVLHWHLQSYWIFYPTGTSQIHLTPISRHPPPTTPNWTPIDIQRVDPHDRSIHIYPSTATTIQKTQSHPPCNSPATQTTVHQYIRAQPEWSRSLLQHVEFIRSAAALQRQIENERLSFFLVSDGSVFDDDSMTFGWVLALRTGDVFVQCKGPAFGRPSSYRAEAYGMLSGVLFLQSLSAVYKLDYSRFSVTFVSDNQALIDYMKDRSTYTDTYPNATLSPEWDITEQAHSTLSSLAIPFLGFEWVKGHQDTTIPLHQLPVEAQLNVQADFLATNYPERTPQRIVPIVPAARCYLVTIDSTITSHFSRTLRHIQANNDLSATCADQFGWSATTIANVDWDSLRLGLSRDHHSCQSHTKLLYGLLPTKRHCNKFKPWSDSLCSYCGAADETFFHLIFCTSNTLASQLRITLRSQLVLAANRHKLSFAQVSAFDNVLSELLTTGTVIARTHPSWLHQALSHQASIGWERFLYGFVSTSWSVLFQLPGSGPKSTFAPSFVATTVSSLLDFWSSHLAHIHKNTALGTDSPALRDELVTRVTALFEYSTLILPADRLRYFPANQQEFLTQSNNSALSYYVDNYSDLIFRSADQFDALEVAQHHPLTSYGFRTTAAPLSRERPNQGSRHHKHTRWKPTEASRRTFRHFREPLTL